MFSHHIGAFFGAWSGGFSYDLFGSYDPVWLVAIVLGLLAAAPYGPIADAPLVPSASGTGTGQASRSCKRGGSLPSILMLLWLTPESVSMTEAETNTRATIPPSVGARFRVVPTLDGLEWLHARFTEERYARHSHPTYVIGVVVSGVEGFRYRGGQRTATAGRILALNPQEPHDGYPVAGHFRYRMIYPSPALLAAVSGRRHGTVYFPEPVIDDPVLAGELAAAHAAIDSESRLAAETRMHEALRQLVERHGRGGVRDRDAAAEPAAEVEAARDVLAARLGDAVSLRELAELTGLPAHRLVRAFTRGYGLPPHAWQLDRRIQHARYRLARQEPISDVALDLGFGDQSHFHRRFRERVGIAPGQYRAAWHAAGHGRERPGASDGE